MTFLGSSNSPFNTTVGQLIDKATDGTCETENWALLLEICDNINELDEGPKDAIRAIRKKLTIGSTKSTCKVWLDTLTVLETCVKNCGHRFHILVANKEFLQDLLKIIGPRNDAAIVVQEKVLGLIQTWADAFKGSPELREVQRVYQELTNKGVEFPLPDIENMAPINTPVPLQSSVGGMPLPKKTASTRSPPSDSGNEPSFRTQPQTFSSSRHHAQTGSRRHDDQPLPRHNEQQLFVDEPTMLDAEQLEKLKRDLGVVRQNLKVLNEMLNELKPAKDENAGDLEVLKDLHTTCRRMQKRLVNVLELVENENVTGDLLRVNDELNGAFARYDRFQRHLASTVDQSPTATDRATETPRRRQSAGVASALPSYQAALAMPDLAKARQSPASIATPIVASEPAIGNLIDFSDFDESPKKGNPTSNQGFTSTAEAPALTAIASGNVVDEFDSFAQSRQIYSKKSEPAFGEFTAPLAPVPNVSPNLQADVKSKPQSTNPFLNQDASPSQITSENDFEEIDRWLEENSKPIQLNTTSEEFDTFLESRSSEGDKPPDVKIKTTSNKSRMVDKS